MRVNLAAELRSEARRGNTASVTRLVLRGANVHDVDEFGLTAMMWAARYGHTDTVTTLIERHGARVEAIDGFGWTALMLATMHGHIDTTTTLIERHGANVEAEDKYGSTPLMKAAKDGHGELVSRLIARHNANVDAADNYGWTPLIWASKHGNAMVVTRLIEMHRANVEAADKEGMTVLIWAAGNGHTETVRTLVERHGASMDRRARNGTRALQFALEKGHQSTAAEISRLQDRQVQTVETAAPMLTSDTTSLRSVGSISASDASRPDFDQLTLGLLLGEGSFGRVHLGSWMETDVAVKVLDRSSFSSLSRERRETTNDLRVLLEESDMMAGLRHPNIVQFIGVSLEGPRPCIITEYCARGSLCDVLRQASSDPRGQTARALTWSRRLSMAQDAAKGMLYLHRLQPRAILHRDLKSPNMLVSSDWTVKVRSATVIWTPSPASQLGPNGIAPSSLTCTRVYLADF